MHGPNRQRVVIVGVLVAVLVASGPFFYKRKGSHNVTVTSESAQQDSQKFAEIAKTVRAREAERPDRGSLSEKSGEGTKEEARPTDAKGLYELGLRLEAKREWEEARKAFLEAAALGDVNALYRSGYYAEHGIGGKVDATAARENYEKAAQAGMVDGYAAIAKMYIQGEAVMPDSELAARYIEKGVQAGSLEALFLKGVTQLSTNPDAAVSCFLKAAEAGNASAQQMLARLSKDGIGVPKDEQKALEWARLAAASGSSGAQVDLAKLLMQAKTGTENDVKEVADNLLAAEAQQNARASLELLTLTLRTPTVNIGDVLNTRELAQQAYTGGEKESAFAVALTYALTQQDGEAKGWLAKGATDGDWRSLYARELMHHSGTSLKDAIAVVSKANYQNYAQYHAEHAPKSSQGTTMPVPVSKTAPVFPPGLEILGAKGLVTAEFVVNEKGVPTAIQVLDSTHPELAEAVVTAISQWRYKPATRNGAAVAQKVRSPITFTASK